MLSCDAPSSFFACVKNSMSPSISTAGDAKHTGNAKLILTAWILQATTPNQWQAAEQKAWDKMQGKYLLEEQNQTQVVILSDIL